MENTLKTIQLKRGTSINLNRFLINENKPQAGELIYETDTKKIKFGDGIHNYADLEYFAAETPAFNIVDALAGEILIYNSETNTFQNKPLADNKAIIYDNEQNGLTLNGYKDASIGQTLLKTSTGVRWQTPLDAGTLTTYVQAAERAKNGAERSELTATNKALETELASRNAQNLNAATIDFVNNKFWWGTVDEYNALTEIKEGTIYFIRTELV